MIASVLNRILYLRKIPREDNSEYLDRYSVTPQTPENQDDGGRTFLHHFLTADLDWLHSHPWKWSWSILMPWSWYDEDYVDFEDLSDLGKRIITNHNCTVEELKLFGIVKSRRVRFFNFISGKRYHRITNISKFCWTIFHSGPKSGDWGFFIPGRGHVHWKQWIDERSNNQNNVPSANLQA